MRNKVSERLEVAAESSSCFNAAMFREAAVEIDRLESIISAFKKHVEKNSERAKQIEQRCVICDCVFIGLGHNPDPVEKSGRCCDDCNAECVVPERISRMRSV